MTVPTGVKTRGLQLAGRPLQTAADSDRLVRSGPTGQCAQGSTWRMVVPRHAAAACLQHAASGAWRCPAWYRQTRLVECVCTSLDADHATWMRTMPLLLLLLQPSLFQQPAGGPAGPSAFQRALSFLGNWGPATMAHKQQLSGFLNPSFQYWPLWEFEFIFASPESPLGVQAMSC